MREQCARAGCSAPATVTFTFDSRDCAVWLDPVSDAGARAGQLCERHAARLVPPQGWQLVDRRPGTAAVATATLVAPDPRPAPVAVTTAARAPEAPAALAGEPPAPAWTPHFDPADDLGGLLDASSPLLGRAFRNLRAV